MTKEKIYLVCRNARDKVQVAIAELEQDGMNFTIHRTTGQFNGKMTSQPDLEINSGKAKRSVMQQAELEFNSVVNKYLDKGYKKLDTLTDLSFNELDVEEIDRIVPSVKSDSQGVKKPMLCKQHDKVAESTFNKPLLCSRKINGVRSMTFINEEGNIYVASRGGKNYCESTKHIIPELEQIFEKFPDIVLDGELYHHLRWLQEISGISRLKTWEPRCEILQLWVYDICDDNLKFEERLEILKQLQEFVEESNFKYIKILDHYKTNSWIEIQKLHDDWVEEGFEGLVARKPDKTYQFGKRGSDMIKYKAYKTGEFKVIDYKDGLRMQDFVFVCETEDGKVFEASPIGTVEQKQWYLDNMDSLIDQMATVKYFDLSKDGIPTQTHLLAFRYEEDLPNEND